MSIGTSTAHAGPRIPAPACAPEPGAAAGSAARIWPLASYLALAALVTAPSAGRAHVRRILAEWGLGHLADDAELLVSELVTNGVRASRPGDPVGLRLLADQEQLIIEVWDHSPGLPRPRHPDQCSPGGRGFSVIGAIASRWGYRRVTASLKVVWCELPTGAVQGRQ